MRFYPVSALAGCAVAFLLPVCLLPADPWFPSHCYCLQGWCFAIPSFVFRLPYALLDATLWSLITYWAVGFDNSWRFLVFWLFMFLTCAW